MPNQSNFSKYKSMMESLEERVMFDGVPDATFILPGADTAAQVPAQTQMEQVEVTAPRELILIDAGVEDGDQLLASILENKSESAFEIRFLDGDSDGVQQISEILSATNYKYDAIHILSHGDEGQVNLGNTILDANNFSEYADELAGWADALTEDADLLFYGCELAGNAEGEQFIESISAITGADVAASDDLTGAEELGGDWDLEFTVGALETTTFFSASGWQGLLASGPEPTAILDVPGEEFINENFEFTVGFDNTSADPAEVGYVPYLDLSVPDGVNLNSASFLGSPLR